MRGYFLLIFAKAVVVALASGSGLETLTTTTKPQPLPPPLNEPKVHNNYLSYRFEEVLQNYTITTVDNVTWVYNRTSLHLQLSSMSAANTANGTSSSTFEEGGETKTTTVTVTLQPPPESNHHQTTFLRKNESIKFVFNLYIFMALLLIGIVLASKFLRFHSSRYYVAAAPSRRARARVSHV